MNDVDANLRGGYGGLDTTPSASSPRFRQQHWPQSLQLLCFRRALHAAAPNGINYYPDGASDSAPNSSFAPIGGPASESPMPITSPADRVMSDSSNPYMTHQDRSGPWAPVSANLSAVMWFWLT